MAEEQVRRLVKIIQILQSGRANLEWLATCCGVHTRTVLRDLQLLRNSGIPIVFDAGEQRYRMSTDFFLPPTHFSPDEAIALITLCLGTEQKTRIPFMESVESAALKLVGILPTKMQEHLMKLGGAMRIHREPINPLDKSREIFDKLLEMFHRRLAVDIRYQGPLDPEPLITTLHPYQFLFARHSWYVIGRSSLHYAERTFHIGRILSIEETSKKYQIPRGFSLERYLRNAWFLIPEPGPDSDVVIRFTPLVAKNVSEIRWHPTQRIVTHADGSIDFHVTVSGLKEISWWILGYGKEAEALSLEPLRDILKKHIEAMAAIYSKPKGSPASTEPPVKKRPHVDLPGWDVEPRDEE